MYKPEQQWITIITGTNNDDNDSFLNDKQTETNNVTSLIDTFTSNLDNNKTDKLETYRVKGDVGTLIAQKLIKGEKIRVCRNGEPVSVGSPDNNELDDLISNKLYKKR